MKIYKIIIDNNFNEDLENIEDIIFRFTLDKGNVLKIINEIYSLIFGLQIFPYRYVEYKNNFRVLNIKGKYKVFYKINEERKEVQVYRILFSKDNLDKIF